MSPTGKEHFRSLRHFFRMANLRGFAVLNRNQRAATILGFGPDDRTMIGWWEGTNTIEHFDPDSAEWSTGAIHD